MANRMKEDEKNDKIIHDLLKLPANRRCINCNSLGPQYVCTNFWTFVCKTCGGIHREFTHRVESVSMAKFTSQEVSALQGGGNERAKEVFFRDLDSQRHSVPDSSNVERLRDFIKHCYVDRRYIGERSLDKPPRSMMGDKEDSIEIRRVDAYRSGSRIPPYEDTNDHHYGERPGPAGRNDERSPGYGQETRYADSRKSPVDDWRRDDRFGNARRSKQRRFSDGESKLEVRSPDSQKDLGVSSSPLVRPVRDILGEHGPPLRIGEPHKANGGKVAEGFTHSQRTASSSSLGSIDGNPVEPKKETLASLIDFDADPEPPNVGVPPAQPVTTPTSQSVTHPTTSPSSDGGNWASFDFTPQAQVHTPAPPSANSLDSVLLQLSAPSTTPFGNMPTAAVTGNISTLPISGGVAAGPGGNMSTLPVSGGFSAVAPGGMMPTMDVGGGESFFRANEGGQWSGMQQQQQQQHKQQRHQPSLFAATDSRSIAPQFTSSVGGATNNQPWNSQAQNVQGPLATTGQPSSSGGFTSQPASLKAKRTGREALPEDLFAATYSAYPEPVQSWHTGPSHGMGYGVQYPTAVAMPSFTHQSKPAKQFDFYNEPTMVHAQSEPMDDLPLPIAQTPMSRRKGKEPIEKPMDMEEEEEESAGEEQPDNEDDDDVDDSYVDDDLDGGGEYSQRTEDDEDSEKYRKKRKLKNWTEPATLVLLNAWRDRSLQRGRKNQRGIKNVRSDEWVEIAKTVSRASDTIRTHTQCKNRLHHLKKKYKQERMKSQVTRTWVYFNQMDMLMQLGKPQKRTRKHIEGQMKRQIRLALKDLDQEDLGYLDGLTPEVYLRNLRELVFLMACRVTSAVVPVSPTPIPSDDTLIPWEHNTILEMIQIGMKEVKGSLICTRCQSIHIAKVDWREGFLCLASYLLGNLFKEGDNSLWAPPSNNNFSVPCILCGEGLSVPCSTTNGSWDWLFLALTHSVCLCPHEAIVGYLRGQRINISSEASQERILLKFYVNIITQLDPTNGWNLLRP